MIIKAIFQKHKLCIWNISKWKEHSEGIKNIYITRHDGFCNSPHLPQSYSVDRALLCCCKQSAMVKSVKNNVDSRCSALPINICAQCTYIHIINSFIHVVHLDKQQQQQKRTNRFAVSLLELMWNGIMITWNWRNKTWNEKGKQNPFTETKPYIPTNKSISYFSLYKMWLEKPKFVHHFQISLAKMCCCCCRFLV